ncbi:MAG: N-acetyltransferase [Oscillospiraceae bacterium]|nr:N-acetyltransferase [Oscillospiraceae bacterium]
MAHTNVNIRLERQSDHDTVERVTFAAFESFEAPGMPKRDIPNEHFLVSLLRGDPEFVPELDFVAELDGEIVGNIMYSKCGVVRPDGTITDALTFGPVSVLPKYQRQGIGIQLIRHSLERALALGYKAVIITGHTTYYPRFGFVPADTFGLTTQDGSTFDAFMALELEPGYLGSAGGKWKCCAAFDVCENDKTAFMEYHRQYVLKQTEY